MMRDRVFYLLGVQEYIIWSRVSCRDIVAARWKEIRDYCIAVLQTNLQFIATMFLFFSLSRKVVMASGCDWICRDLLQ